MLLSNVPMTKTNFEFLYRDASNYKKYNHVILDGLMTEDDYNAILACLDEGEWFIPDQVGLEGERFGEETEDDHPWFEVTGYEHLPDTVRSCGMTVAQLVANFKAAAGHWQEPDFTPVYDPLHPNF